MVRIKYLNLICNHNLRDLTHQHLHYNLCKYQRKYVFTFTLLYFTFKRHKGHKVYIHQGYPKKKKKNLSLETKDIQMNMTSPKDQNNKKMIVSYYDKCPRM